MIRLAKYLKPYLLLLVVAIALLYVQADANLALPDYFSRIVNVGIQQQGIENAVPDAMRRVTMDRLAPVPGEGVGRPGPGSLRARRRHLARVRGMLSKYPALAGDPVYVRRALDKAGIDAINTDMAKAWLVVAGIEKAVSDPAAAAAMAAAPARPVEAAPGTDPFAMLKLLPPLARYRMLKTIDEKFAAMGSGIAVQARRRHGAGGVHGPRRGHGAPAGRLHAAHGRHDAAAHPGRRRRPRSSPA